MLKQIYSYGKALMEPKSSDKIALKIPPRGWFTVVLASYRDGKPFGMQKKYYNNGTPVATYMQWGDSKWRQAIGEKQHSPHHMVFLAPDADGTPTRLAFYPSSSEGAYSLTAEARAQTADGKTLRVYGPRDLQSKGKEVLQKLQMILVETEQGGVQHYKESIWTLRGKSRKRIHPVAISELNAQAPVFKDAMIETAASFPIFKSMSSLGLSSLEAVSSPAELVLGA